MKVSVVAESYAGTETVCAAARRHGLSWSQLFTWRRELRKQMETQGLMLPSTPAPAARFVPAVVEPVPSSDPAPAAARRRRRRGTQATAVELEIDGVAVKIAHGAERDLITAVIEALKVTR